VRENTWDISILVVCVCVYLFATTSTVVVVFAVAAGTEVNVATSGVLLYGNSDEFVQVVQMALQQTADMRAQNGAEMSRVNFAQDLLNINAINLEAANSRIIDVDVAAESSQLARFQILQQAGTAMLAQANTSQQSLVRLLQG
jgi:flagellin